MTAAEARSWAAEVGALDGIRASAAAAPPLPGAAGDLLRRLDYPAAGATPAVAAAGRGAA